MGRRDWTHRWRRLLRAGGRWPCGGSFGLLARGCRGALLIYRPNTGRRLRPKSGPGNNAGRRCGGWPRLGRCFTRGRNSGTFARSFRRALLRRRRRAGTWSACGLPGCFRVLRRLRVTRARLPPGRRLHFHQATALRANQKLANGRLASYLKQHRTSSATNGKENVIAHVFFRLLMWERARAAGEAIADGRPAPICRLICLLPTFDQSFHRGPVEVCRRRKVLIL